ncbi:MAG: hypothetical protein PHU23_03165 [Dehalococcoidales bacterium]|nr:hypothetical protein [Dehalococcoidales bacterium]
MTVTAESAIRSKIFQGQILQTPDLLKSAPFEVGVIDSVGIVLLFGLKRTETLIPWRCLEGIPSFLRGKDWVEIGTIFDVKAKSDTLDSYMKQWINRGTAGWVAVVLEKAGIVEIDRKRPLKLRLIEW